MLHVSRRRALRDKLVLAALIVVSAAVVTMAGKLVWTRARVVRLVARLGDESPEVRATAELALSKIGERRGLMGLLGAETE